MELVAFQGLLVLKCLRSWVWEFGRREKTSKTLCFIFPLVFCGLFSKQAMKGLIFFGFCRKKSMYCLEEQRLAGKIIHDFELVETLLQETRLLLMHSQILPRFLCL